MTPRLANGQFYGELLKHRDVAGLTLTDYRYPPNLKTPIHSHDSAYFCIVLNGSYGEKTGNVDRVCQRATVLFHPPGEIHQNHFHGAGGRIFSIEVHPEWMERIGEHAASLDDRISLDKGMAACLTMKLYDEFGAVDGVSHFAIEGLMLELFAEATRRSPQVPERRRARWLQKVREIVNERFCEDLSIPDIANMVSVHPVYLARSFRLCYRQSLGNYIQKLRIEFACREIANTSKSLAEIAVAAGFYDQSHFSKAFKQVTGLTPAAYRATWRSGSCDTKSFQ